MRIRTVAIAGAALTFAASQFITSALAQSVDQDPLAVGKRVVAAYQETNRMTAECMRGKGLAFNPGLAKADVADAFGLLAGTQLSGAARAQAQSMLNQAADDPNAAALSMMSPRDQAVWVNAVNGCSAQVDLAASGGEAGRAKAEAALRAAKTSPEVATAATAYVSCMSSKGFRVSVDPESAPQDLMNAEDSSTEAAQQLVARYDAAWRACVQPYQQTLNRKLFG